MIFERENQELKIKYKEINDKFMNAQLKINALNTKKNDIKY